MGTSGNRQVVFKQFTVHDDRCGMKVGTDALLLGAWADVARCQNVCDIGAGSGIVTLMLAQRAKQAQIASVEIERQAYEQCIENVRSSPFSNRIEVHLESIQHYANQSIHQGQYDAVVSNPPFFHGKPKSPYPERNLARHDDALSLSDLLNAAKRLLKSDGSFSLIWPVERESELDEMAQGQGLSCKRKCTIHGRNDLPPVRFLSEWFVPSGESKISLTLEKLIIEEGERALGQPLLSTRYKELLNDFVLDWPVC